MSAPNSDVEGGEGANDEAGGMRRPAVGHRKAGHSRVSGTRHYEQRRTRARDLDGQEVAALVTRAQAGDQDAFGLLYLEFRRRIYNLARFSLSHSAAEDAVGETFVRAWAALPRYRDTGAPFVAWLYGIARHVVADTVRASVRVEPQAEPDCGGTDTRGREDDRLLLGAALGQLPPEQRMVIELKFLGGLSNDEVAATLGKSPGAVNTQQWRALASLRAILEVDDQ